MSTTPYIDAFNMHGSVRKAASAMGIARSTFFDNLNKERSAISSLRNREEPFIDPVRSSNKPRYYIFTAAARGAAIHTDFFNNLKAYAAHLGAEFIIGPLTSNGRQRFAEYDSTEFAQELVPYLSTEPVEVGGRVRFCPELNLTPTMVKPLQGLQTYTKRMWGIFPHTKISLETVATHKDRPAKFITTTGAVTHPFYTPTKAGHRAHFDHVHGAVILEVTKKGVWFRHLTPTNELDGTFYDLGRIVRAGKVEWHDGVEALIYGDIHVEKIDPQVAKATWGYRTNDEKLKNYTPLAQFLQPSQQVFHDLMDMTFANYHELDDIFKRYSSHMNGELGALSAFNEAYEFLEHVKDLAIQNVVVDSNHDHFIKKWLLKFDPAAKEDFQNMEAYYSLKLAVFNAIKIGRPYSLLEVALRNVDLHDYSIDDLIDEFKFLKTDESFEIHNIECGWHGHAGPNGRRGSKHAFKFVTEKSTIAHLHSPAIESGAHVVGTSTKMDLGYNAGPSSWAHTHGVIYPNGGRALVTMSDGKFWATQGDVT